MSAKPLNKMIFLQRKVCFWICLEKDTQAHHSTTSACCGGSQLTRLGNQYRLISHLLP